MGRFVAGVVGGVVCEFFLWGFVFSKFGAILWVGCHVELGRIVFLLL